MQKYNTISKNNKHISILQHKVQIVQDLPKNIEWSDNIGVDTETMGLQPRRDRLCVIQIFNPANSTAYVIETPAQKIKAPNLVRVLKDNKICKIMHFARFDLRVIKEYFNLDIKNFFCTHIASVMARTYSSRHSLFILCSEFLNVTLNKTVTSSDWGNHGKLSQEQINYAAGDVLYLHLIKEKLIQMLQREKRLKL